MSLRVDQLVIDRRDGVLPQQLLCRDFRAEVTRARPHVAVRQLEPGPGEGIGELVRVLVEAPRDLFIGRVEAQGEIRGQHGRRVPFRGVEGIGDRAGPRAVLGAPLVGAGRALGQLPLVAEQVREEAVAPLGRRRGPGDLEAAADRVTADAGAERACPAEALQRDAAGFRRHADQGRVAGAMGLAEAVTAGDERYGLLVVHCHAREGVADIPGRGERIRIAVRPFRVDVDQTHLHCGERRL